MHRIDGTMAETHDNNVSRDDVLRALDASFGTWADRDFDGASYVEALRRGAAWRLTRPQPDV